MLSIICRILIIFIYPITFILMFILTLFGGVIFALSMLPYWVITGKELKMPSDEDEPVAIAYEITNKILSPIINKLQKEKSNERIHR